MVTTSEAQQSWPTTPSSYSVSLEDEQGNPLRTFYKAGSTFVLGAMGERYNVRIRNHTDRRVEAVVSIDGRDAVSGRVGDYTRERGYVIQPYDSVVVDGFRQDLSRAASFRFSSPRDSYSSRMGTPENVGVIGVAFFPERYSPRVRPTVRPVAPRRDDLYEYEARTSKSAPEPAPKRERSAAEAPTAAPAKPAAKRSSGVAGITGGTHAESRAPADRASRLGTEYGESRYSPTTEVAFQRQSPKAPSSILTLRYDDERGLLARGIEVYPPRYLDAPRAAAPQAFPGNRFAPPPPPY